MDNCKNCYSDIPDMRNGIRCSVCNSPLHKECAINDGASFCDACHVVKEETTPTLQFDVPPFIRRSYIETYRACPFKFYNEVILGIEQPTNIYAQLGIDLHTFFDKACQDRRYKLNDMLDSLASAWNGYTDDMFKDADLKSKLSLRGVNCVSNFYNVLKDLPEVPHKTEETIQYSIGEGLPLVQCTSDRVDLIDGELEMLDWKTGKVMVGNKFSSDLQAPLYIYGVRNKYQIPIRKFTLLYLDENKSRTFTRVNNDEYVCTVGKRDYYINITDAIREVQAIFSQIKKGNFGVPSNTKKMYFTCKWCHLQALEICKGADIQGWRQFN